MRLYTNSLDTGSKTVLAVSQARKRKYHKPRNCFRPPFRAPGTHTQGATLDELVKDLREVIAMLLEDGDPKLESEFVGLQTIRVG